MLLNFSCLHIPRFCTQKKSDGSGGKGQQGSKLRDQEDTSLGEARWVARMKRAAFKLKCNGRQGQRGAWCFSFSLAVAKVPFNLLYKNPLPFKFPFPQGWQINHSSLAITGELQFLWPAGDCNASNIHFPNTGCACFPEWSSSDSTLEVSTSKTTTASDSSSLNSLHLNDIWKRFLSFLSGFEEGINVLFSFALKI